MKSAFLLRLLKVFMCNIRVMINVVLRRPQLRTCCEPRKQTDKRHEQIPVSLGSRYFHLISVTLN